MSSFGAGGQIVISVHCLLKSQGGRDLRFMVNKVFGALAANFGSGSTDGRLSSIAVCSLHGCHGNNIFIVVFLVGSFTCGLFCGAGLVLCLPPLRRYPSVLDTGKMVAVEYEGETGLFDSRHAQHHRKDVRFSDRPLLDSHSRWRRVPRAPPSPAGDRHNMAQREERTHHDDDYACWSPLGAGLRLRSSQAHIALSRSHRAGGSRSPRDGGHTQGG